MAGFPAQVLLSLLGVQTVSEVVSRSIFNFNYLRHRSAKLLEKPLGYVPVSQLISCRDIIDLSRDSPLECQLDGCTEVHDVRPIADLPSSAIKRNVHSVQCSDDDLGNELLRMLTRSEV